MDEALKLTMELSHTPMLAAEQSSLVFLNAAGRALFPELAVGASLLPIFPSELLFAQSEQFITSVFIRETAYTVAARRLDSLLLLSLLPDTAADTSLLSDGILVGMRSTLFNIGLSARRLASLDAITEDEKKYLIALQHSYHQLLRQISNLTLAKSLADGKTFLRLCRIDLVAFCRELIDAVVDLYAESEIRLDFSTPFSTLYADVDPEKLERLLLNLISNSFAHCNAGCTILLRLNKNQTSAVFSLDDDGEGIPPEILQNVFRRFSVPMTLDRLSQPGGGGLGLGIASGIAALHKGSLLIESRPESGTTVRLQLPLEQTKSDLLQDYNADGPQQHITLILTELADVLPTACYDAELSPDEISSDI